MRLSGWVEIAPRPEAMTPKVLAVVEPMLVDARLRAGPDCWVAWGDDPSVRYSVFAADGRRPGPGQRPGQRPGRGASGRRQADPLDPRPGRRAGDRDAGRPPHPELHARGPDPAWHGRRVPMRSRRSSWTCSRPSTGGHESRGRASARSRAGSLQGRRQGRRRPRRPERPLRPAPQGRSRSSTAPKGPRS